MARRESSGADAILDTLAIWRETCANGGEEGVG